MRAPSLTLVPLLCLIAAGCGGAASPAEAPPPPPPPAPSATPGAAASATPAPDDTSSAPSSSDASDCPDGMAKVDAGTLWMGSPDGVGPADEHPQHKVAMLAFCMDKHEVTVGDYQACVKNAICDPLPTEVQLLKPQKAKAHDKRSALCTGSMKDNADLPLNCVDHDLAQKYCDWKGRRLPTEPEWEFAATGGDDKLAFPWGNDAPSHKNNCWQAKGPCKVASTPPGAFGLYDMAGDLSEWTATTYGPYPTPPDASSAITVLSVRGGNWQTSKPDDASPKRRAHEEPLFADITLGFRCAKDL